MGKYTLQVHKDVEETCKAAAAAVVAAVNEAIAARGRCCLALSGGNTPRKLYQMLAASHRKEANWSKVEFFWGDERPVPPDDPQSNYRMAHETLLAPLEIQEERIHRIRAEMPDKAATAQEYQNEIASILAGSPFGEPPSLDLVLLGLGPDAHTASLFPATPALSETHRWVMANPVVKLNAVRLTMTAMLINRAAQVFFLAEGAEKAQPLADVLEGPIDPQRVPAQLIRPASGKLVWFVDQAAASKLKRKK